jgi:Fic family protein
MTSNRIDIAGTVYTYDSSVEETLRGLAERVATLRASGKLSPEVLHTIRNYFRIKNIYHSNAIEGNLLNVGETRQVVELGLTLTGKPLKDQAEARNLANAIDFLEDLASDTTKPILESEVRQIHALVLESINPENAGMYRSVPVEISGSEYKPPTPESVPPEMTQFSSWLGKQSVPGEKFATLHALLVAAAAHTWLVYIHPFIDGNGRVARLLMNLILMRYGFPIAIITREDRLRYYDALEASQTSDLTPFLSLIGESIFESLEEYEEAAKEQRERDEWAKSLANKMGAAQQVVAYNQYELFKSAMELMLGYMRQTAQMIDDSLDFGHVYFKSFGNLELEKYLTLREVESTKRTWFFRVDFRSGDKAARYLFFFGYPSYQLRSICQVTLHVAREEPPGSYSYQRLEQIFASNVPALYEVGHDPSAEQFVARYKNNVTRAKIEQIGRQFFDEVVRAHFSN